MPELPEVETVARGLQRSVAGRRILSVTLRKRDFIDDPVAIERELPGRRIVRVESTEKDAAGHVFPLVSVIEGVKPCLYVRNNM